MSVQSLWRWAPVALYSAATLLVLLLVLVPSHRGANRRSSEITVAQRELEVRQALLAAFPHRESELDSLVAKQSAFVASLRTTDEIDRLMRDLVDRASAFGVEYWTLNPSLPAMIELDRAPDSVARLQMATLPIEFVCRGEFVSVGRFLEDQERRLEFRRWRRLTVTPDTRKRGVHASGEFELFLLPAKTGEGS